MADNKDMKEEYVPFHGKDDAMLRTLVEYSAVDHLIILQGNYIEAARYAMDLAHYTGRTYHEIAAGPKDIIGDI